MGKICPVEEIVRKFQVQKEKLFPETLMMMVEMMAMTEIEKERVRNDLASLLALVCNLHQDVGSYER